MCRHNKVFSSQRQETQHGVRSKSQIDRLKQHALGRLKIGCLGKASKVEGSLRLPKCRKTSTKWAVDQVIVAIEQANITETIIQIATEVAREQEKSWVWSLQKTIKRDRMWDPK